MSEHIHVTKTGVKIPVSKMSDTHLANTIAMIERKAKSGVKIRRGGGTGFCPDSFYYEECDVYGKEALEFLEFSKYTAELEKRRDKRMADEDAAFEWYGNYCQEKMYS